MYLGTERAKRATPWEFRGESPLEKIVNHGGSNIDIQLSLSHMEYEFNITYLTI